MKKVILWAILIVLIVCCLLISYFKFSYSEPIRYVSYELKNYNSVGVLEGSGINDNFSLEINFKAKDMTLCVINMNECSSYHYKLKDGKYYVSSSNKLFLDGRLEFDDSFTNRSDDFVTFNINYEDVSRGRKILSFKKSNSMNVENAR